MNTQTRRLVIAGGSGFLGRALARYFAPQGWEVVTLSRSRPRQEIPARWVPWDGLRQGDWASTPLALQAKWCLGLLML